MTALMSHACWCDVGGVKRELRSGANPNAQDESGFTALIWNCRMGGSEQIRKRKRIFRLLVKHGASIYVCDTGGDDALFHACDFGSNRAIRRFMKEEFSRRKSANRRSSSPPSKK